MRRKMLKKQAEWFRLFLDCYWIDTYFDVDAENEMRRLNVSRPDILTVIDGCNIIEYDNDASTTCLVLEDSDCDGRVLRVSLNVENDILRIGVVWVSMAD